MKIGVGKTAVVQYTLSNALSAVVIESTSTESPAVFKFGTNQLLPEFEENLTGLCTNDTFDFTIEAANAYGPVDPYAIFDIPLDTFEVDGKIDDKMIQVGNIIPMTDNDGNKHHGKIIKVMSNAITMDFNHPLAGQDIHFKGRILEVTAS